MLEIKNITKSFGKNIILDNVSFNLQKGKITALLGENGAGKTTLLRILSGFFDADSGIIQYKNINLSSDRLPYLRNIGYVQEISSLYGDMNIYEFLQYTAQLRNINKNEIDSKILHVMQQLELTNVAWQKNETLSKGYKKRVELAYVLLSEPQIMLLDEPTEGLDPNQKQSLRKIIKDFAQNHIVLISTHTMEDVEAIADNVLLLHKGKILSDTTLHNFKQTADNDLLKSFRRLTK